MARCTQLQSTHRAQRRSGQGNLARDIRGAAQTEYVILVGMVGLAVVFALITVGPRLVRDFQRSRAIITAPLP